MRVFEVREKAELLPFLFQILSDTKKTRVRLFLKFGSVSVNGRVVTQFNHPLRPGDKVTIEKAGSGTPKPSVPLYGVKILYEDDSIIVADKPSGLLTIATEKVQTRTAFYAVNQRVKDQAVPHAGRRAGIDSRKKLFLVHRLDKETSGLLVFAKSASDKLALQEQWKQRRVQKKYFAVVEGTPKQNTDTVRSFLRENKFLKVYSTRQPEAGKLAVTRYSVVRSTPRYALVEVEIETGRKHQIRVHFADLGHPIAGDKMYGAKSNPAGRLALHAAELAFKHPVTDKELIFKSPLPGALENILKI